MNRLNYEEIKKIEKDVEAEFRPFELLKIIIVLTALLSIYITIIK